MSISSTATPLLGILAGMGPDSTAPFVRMVVTECRSQYGASQDEDFPAMSIVSWPTPFRPDRPVDHEALRESIERGLELLSAHRPAVVAMPCNTAHLYWDRLQARIDAPLLNMVAAAVVEIPREAKRVAVLATRVTRDSELYQTALRNRNKRSVTSEALQRAIDRALVAAKRNPTEGIEAWAGVKAALEQLEVDATLVACSDLTPLARRDALPESIWVDATRVLARDLISRWLSLAERSR